MAEPNDVNAQQVDRAVQRLMARPVIARRYGAQLSALRSAVRARSASTETGGLSDAELERLESAFMRIKAALQPRRVAAELRLKRLDSIDQRLAELSEKVAAARARRKRQEGSKSSRSGERQ